MNNTLNYDNILVKQVSEFSQNHMRINNLKVMTADECANLLNENLVL